MTTEIDPARFVLELVQAEYLGHADQGVFEESQGARSFTDPADEPVQMTSQHKRLIGALVDRAVYVTEQTFAQLEAKGWVHSEEEAPWEREEACGRPRSTTGNAPTAPPPWLQRALLDIEEHGRSAQSFIAEQEDREGHIWPEWREALLAVERGNVSAQAMVNTLEVRACPYFSAFFDDLRLLEDGLVPLERYCRIDKLLPDGQMLPPNWKRAAICVGRGHATADEVISAYRSGLARFVDVTTIDGPKDFALVRVGPEDGGGTE